MAQGTVTIITPVYNGLAYVETAWQSLLAQTHTQWEWLVVDNASTDAGMERLRALVCGDPRVRFLCEPLKGTGNARNAALPPIWKFMWYCPTGMSSESTILRRAHAW